MLSEIKASKKVGIGILVANIPICSQKNLKNTYMVYQLLENRKKIQFGLTTGNMEDPEFPLGNNLGKFIEENEYTKDDLWYFVYCGKRSWWTDEKSGFIGKITDWVIECHDHLTIDLPP